MEQGRSDTPGSAGATSYSSGCPGLSRTRREISSPYGRYSRWKSFLVGSAAECDSLSRCAGWKEHGPGRAPATRAVSQASQRSSWDRSRVLDEARRETRNEDWNDELGGCELRQQVSREPRLGKQSSAEDSHRPSLYAEHAHRREEHSHRSARPA